MTNRTASNTVRFGRTLLATAVGKAADQSVQGIVCAANSRGLMGAHSAGAPRLLVGPEVEREAMAGAPYELGTAFTTGAGRLATRGIQVAVHAVIVSRLGDIPRLPAVRRALGAALQQADAAQVRSLALPLLGLPPDPTAEERLTVTDALIEEIVAYLRRAATRLDLILVTATLPDDADAAMAAIRRSRERSWVSRA
jgi:O-acetyl-ADP-ribose deacetylase (regulator of RNase III)